MIAGRRRPGVFLLAIATMMFSLVLLSATSSGAQTGTEDRNKSARAAAGGGECVDFGNGNSNVGTNEDPGMDTSEAGEGTSPDATSDNATSDNATDPDASDDESANATDESTNNGENTGTDTGTGTASENAGTRNDGTGTGTNGEDSTASQDDGTESGDTTSAQDEGSKDGECVVADTVPDESLLPTGAPEKSRTGEKTAEKKSDRDGQQESREGTTREKTTSSEAQKKSDSTGKQRDTTGAETRKTTSSGTQKKTNGSEAQRKSNRGQTQNKSGSGGTQGETANGETRKKPGRGETVEFRGQKVEIDDRAGKEPRQEELETPAGSAATSDPAPRLAATEWTRPSREEILSTKKPRRFAPDPGSEMSLSARALGLYDVPVASSSRREDLDNGLVRVPETSRPWDEGDQKNVFIAGHYLGTPGTQSRLAFYNLHELKSGDELVLKDGRGQAYKYRVSEKFAVGPGDSWAMGQVQDRDMVTLQTCIPPDFGKRLIVRADRVEA